MLTLSDMQLKHALGERRSQLRVQRSGWIKRSPTHDSTTTTVINKKTACMYVPDIYVIVISALISVAMVTRG